MNTTSLEIANYCVPCHSRCRYCLLESCGKSTGVDNRAAMEFTDRIAWELEETRPEIRTQYCIGYSMDMPDLMEYLRFCREHCCPSARFLQMNGFAFRTDEELDRLLGKIKENGVELIDLTFYGTEEYHDRFAGRKGDFRFLLRMLAAANRVDLTVTISVPLLRENLNQTAELLHILQEYRTEKVRFFPPHSKGRGKTVTGQRITKQEFDGLPEEVRARMIITKTVTEAEWLLPGELVPPEKRTLAVVLTPENFGRISKMNGGEILERMEEMDDKYLREMPSIPELAERYGDPEGQKLYRQRDLLLEWEQRYIADTGNTIWDMHDETHHFAVHY